VKILFFYCCAHFFLCPVLPLCSCSGCGWDCCPDCFKPTAAGPTTGASMPLVLPSGSAPPSGPVLGAEYPTAQHHHPLKYQARAPYYSGTFRCNVCSRHGSGPVYNCPGCSFDCHPACFKQVAPEAQLTARTAAKATAGGPVIGQDYPTAQHGCLLKYMASVYRGEYTCNMQVSNQQNSFRLAPE
jgi:hypothetical protein